MFRTVSFHKELPWLISCGDDMTIRIWNWINRQLLITATDDHYVMSAFFHPSQDWIVSSSLDSTIRIILFLEKNFMRQEVQNLKLLLWMFL